MKKRILKTIILYIVCFIAFSSYSIFGTNVEINARTIPSKENNLLASKIAINEGFDLRDYISIKVRNQERTNTCWAISTNTILETNLLLTQNIGINFSERYLEYATTRFFKNNEENKIGYNRKIDEGGDAITALAFYTAGYGPVLEKNMPFENNTELIDLEEIQNKSTAKKIEEYVKFSDIYKKIENGQVKYYDGEKETKEYTAEEVNKQRMQIKEHIVQYGGITASMSIGNKYGNGMKCDEYSNDERGFLYSVAYYCDNNEEEPDHAVTIIGWDDNYEVTNFNEDHRPINKGAYIVLNSHGENFNNNGYIYISYDDVNIEKYLFGVKKISDVDYSKIYQYDEYGRNNIMRMEGKTKSLYLKNVFKRNVLNTEYLNEVSVYCMKNHMLDVYVSLGGELIKVAGNANCEKEGYFTFKLKNPQRITKEEFEVIVKYTSNSDDVEIPVECFEENDLHKYATINEKETYVSTDGNKYFDMQELNGGNACIKAFTIIEEQLPQPPVNPEPPDTPDNPEPPVAPDQPDTPDNPEPPVAPDQPEYSKGDVNQNNVVDLIDLMKICKHILEKEILTGEKFELADINNDEKIDMVDIIKTIKIILAQDSNVIEGNL